MKKIGKHLDYFFNKMLPKKFIVYFVSTWLISLDLEIPTEYWYVAIAYLLGNAASKRFMRKNSFESMEESIE